MTIHSMSDHRARQRAAADAVLADVEREVIAARDAIMSRALTRLSKADPYATLEPTVERLGQVWRDAWPFGSAGGT